MLLAPLSRDIHQEYTKLKQQIESAPAVFRFEKAIKSTGRDVNISDLIAYQIGWGKAVIRWYHAGLNSETPIMPGDGFTAWNYTAIAEHFYHTYRYSCTEEQNAVFDQVVAHLIEITEQEHQMGRLEQTGIWPWCTLHSGKQWPLSKWIRVNSCAPYKRARNLIRTSL